MTLAGRGDRATLMDPLAAETALAALVDVDGAKLYGNAGEIVRAARSKWLYESGTLWHACLLWHVVATRLFCAVIIVC